MPTATSALLRLESAARRPRFASLLVWGVVVALLAASWRGADMRPLDIVRDAGHMARYATDFFPPHFAQWRLYLQQMVTTLQIALWGTALALVTAIPLGRASAANIAPIWTRQPVRRAMDAARAIN